MSPPAGAWTLSVLLAVLASASADSQVKEDICGIADLNENGSEYIKPFTCDNPGGAPPVQAEKQQIPAEEFPWIGILSSSTSKQKTCLGVVISQDLVVASKPCEESGSYTFEISHLNFISDLSVVPPKAGVNSENKMLVFKLGTHLPPSKYRPACVPDQHFVPKAVKASDSCQGETNTLLKVSLKDGNIVSSRNNILTDEKCANNILLNKNAECWKDFDHSQNPCMTIDKTRQKNFKNYEDYTCHRGILQAVSKCHLNGIEGEAKCVGVDEKACIGYLQNSKQNEFHVCRKEVVEYTKCITKEFIALTNNDTSSFPFSGVNCLHSYLPGRPECAKHPTKKGLASLGAAWSFNVDKAYKFHLQACNQQKGRTLQRSCKLNKTATFDWMKRKPYEGKWSISMLKEMMTVNTCIIKATGCNICSSTGGSVCIDQVDDSGETEFLFWYESCRDRWFFLGPSTTEKRKKICSQTQLTELPFLEQNTQLIREYASADSSKKITILPLYPKPVFVMLGNTGVGKSTVANALLMGHAGNKQCFKTSSGASSQTKMTKWSKGKWLGVGHCVTVIDTPGTQDTGGKQRDYENVMNIMNILKDEVKQIDVFVVLFNGGVPRFGPGIQNALNTYEALFGDTFWNHVVTEFTFWKFVNSDIKDRYITQCRDLKDDCYDEESESCNGGMCDVDGLPIDVYGESPAVTESNAIDYIDYSVYGPYGGRRKRSVGDQNLKRIDCKLMLEDEGSFTSDTSSENIVYSNGSVTEDFWDNDCGWRDLPDEKDYPGGTWNEGNKGLYNKADLVSRYIKADSWNEKYEEKMKVDKNIPSVFINPLWSTTKLGCERFQRETNKLWKTVEDLDPYSCSDKCEAPDSYFVGKPHIFGQDTIYVKKSAETAGSPLQCSVWSGIEGAAGAIDVQWYHSDNMPLQVSNNPSDLFSVKILEKPAIIQNALIATKHQSLQLSINVAKITSGDIGLYYCYLENHPPGSKPFMKRGTLVSKEMKEKAVHLRKSITVNCDIEISKEEMKIKLPEVKWFFAQKLDTHRSNYDMSLDSEAKHDQFSVQKLIFERMDKEYEGNYSCKVGGKFSDEVKVNMNVDAVWSQWGSWSECSASCGNNRVKHRTRTCSPPINKGINCNDLTEKAVKDESNADMEIVNCGYLCCPTDGQWSQWQSWSPCSQPCTDSTNPQTLRGEKTRQRRCNEPSVDCGGKDCKGDLEQVSSCNGHFCKIHGGWIEWTSWSACIKDPKKCYGTLTRTRTCTNPEPRYGGMKCQDAGVQTQNCNPLCPVDCKATDWADWSECSKKCKQYKSSEQGTRRRQRGSIPEVDKGKTCQELRIHLEETESCIVDKICPRDGEWGVWGNDGPCDTTSGKKIRERSCYFKDSNMQELFDSNNVNAGHGCVGDKVDESICPVECQCTARWENWETCSEPCYKPGKKLKRKRRRSCIPAKNGGRECTDADKTEEEECPIPRCGYKIDGQWSEWGDYSACPAECGGGTQTKKRNCIHPQKAILESIGDFDPKKDILKPCVGQGIEKNKEKCNKQACSIQSLTFIMDTSCSFDGTDQDTAKELASELTAELLREDIIVPKYRVVGSPGSRPVEDLGEVSLIADFILQYTKLLTRNQCGAQFNLDAILYVLENGAKDGAVICLFTDTGTAETNSDEVTKKIVKEAANKQATIVIFITPKYGCCDKSMMQYRIISENRVYEMDSHKADDVIGVVKRKLQKKDALRCIASGGPLWPIEKYECQFPFKYEGVEYNKCTETDHVQPWCSTFVDVDGKHKDGEVGLCGDCSGVQDPACSSYTVLNEANRNIKSGNKEIVSSADYNRATWSGYYRFKSPAGIKLPEDGSDVLAKEAWIQGGHPKVNEKVQRKRICFGPRCDHAKQIRIVTCSSNRGESFHLYELEKPPAVGYTYFAKEGKCPTDWVTINSTNPIICIGISTDKLTWEQAKATCEAMNGQLFEPQTENMNDKVWKYVKLAEKLDVVTNYWVAFNDKTKEEDFGTSLTNVWLSGHPLNDNNRNCVNVITKSGKWIDNACSNKLHYICQRPQNI